MKPLNFYTAMGSRPLSDTIARLSAFRGLGDAAAFVADDGRLTEFTDFAPNPGALRALAFVPPGLAQGAPLVVVLHGCKQTAGGYDRASGWSALAERQGFALLYPEQSRTNNPNGCFNWFDRRDARRDSGEAMSIRRMIEAFAARHGSDPKRIFITGLSAGGAMTSVMLAAYPELFAGGAIVAGLPFGVANSVPEAFDRMRGHGLPDETRLQTLLREASSHKGPWPTLSVWHGTADQTVADANLEAIVAQWRGVAGVSARPTETETVHGATRRVWRDGAGRDRIEAYSIPGMGHGTPLDPRLADGGGVPAPFMLDAGIASTRQIARFWGLIPPGEGDVVLPPGTTPASPKAASSPRKRDKVVPVQPAAAPEARSRIGRTIEEALRAAGLLRRG